MYPDKSRLKAGRESLISLQKLRTSHVALQRCHQHPPDSDPVNQSHPLPLYRQPSDPFP